MRKKMSLFFGFSVLTIFSFTFCSTSAKYHQMDQTDFSRLEILWQGSYVSEWALEKGSYLCIKMNIAPGLPQLLKGELDEEKSKFNPNINGLLESLKSRSKNCLENCTCGAYEFVLTGTDFSSIDKKGKGDWLQLISELSELLKKERSNLESCAKSFGKDFCESKEFEKLEEKF